MEYILYDYDLNPTTWAYLSSIAIFAFFFKFHRFLSVRNLDVLGLIGMAPGLLLVSEGSRRGLAGVELSGYLVLLGISLFFLARLILDLFMTRRPLLEPNLSLGGMSCILIALAVFVGTAIVNKQRPAPIAGEGTSAASQPNLATRAEPAAPTDPHLRYAFLDLFPEIPSRLFPATHDAVHMNDLWTRLLCLAGHLAVVAGLIYVGHRHFDNAWTGVALAALYLMLPYTQQMAGRPLHVVPAALLVWMLAMYRHPLASGTLLGASIALIYYPVFLIPLWVSFYSRRGLVRFLAGAGSATGAMALVAWLFLPDRFGMFLGHYADMFRLSLENADGLWAGEWLHPYTRFPLSIVFCCFAAGMAIWPARKNFGTLLGCSAAVMLATQFWYPSGGLLYMNWYLPLLLLTMFRPNLEHRVATATVVARSIRRRVELRSTKDTPA